MPSGSISVVADGKVSFFFLLLSNGALYIYNRSHFLYPVFPGYILRLKKTQNTTAVCRKVGVVCSLLCLGEKKGISAYAKPPTHIQKLDDFA